MTVLLAPIDPNGDDRDDLIDFFSANTFPHHQHSTVRSRSQAAEFVDSDALVGDDGAALWIVDSELGRIGLVRLADLSETTPEFDLRLGEAFRDRGRGVETLRTVTDHVFTTSPAERFAGTTRADNAAMRTVFLRAGWSKEAHHRRAWPGEGRSAHDAIAYAILREEWARGVTIPLVWNDFPEPGASEH